MKTLARALPLWLILASLSTWLGLASDESLTGVASVAALLLLGPLAGWLTSSAVANLPAHGPKRGMFWGVTALGWSVLAILMQGRGEANQAARTVLLLSAQLIAVALLWRMIRTRQTPTWRGVGEVAASLVFVVLLAGVIYQGYEGQTRAIAARAEARWVAIGRPMAEFEKGLKPSRENAGSPVLRDVLRTRANALYYRAGTKAAALEPQIEPSPAITELLEKAVEIISQQRAPADDLALPAKALPLLEAQSPELDEMYRRLLAVEPATWASDPHEGYAVSVPNFLGIRRLSQLIAADALRREAAGDEEGAAQAIAAGLQLRAGLVENPTLVSMMIAVAVDAMLYPQQARLPAAEDGLASIARDTHLWRAEYLRRLQMHAWSALHHLQHPTAASVEGMAIHLSSPLPDWADTLANAAWVRRQCAVAALCGAEHTAIEQESTTISLPDFGASRHEAVSQAHPSKLEFNSVRATMRIHATLLLREQTELIRVARAPIAAGRVPESRDSLVLPGTRWELTADLEKQTVRIRLAGAPDWIIKNETCPREFWLLPVDGSESWKFRPTTRTAQRD